MTPLSLRKLSQRKQNQPNTLAPVESNCTFILGFPVYLYFRIPYYTNLANAISDSQNTDSVTLITFVKFLLSLHQYIVTASILTYLFVFWLFPAVAPRTPPPPREKHSVPASDYDKLVYNCEPVMLISSQHNACPYKPVSSPKSTLSSGKHLQGCSDLMQLTPTTGRRPNERLSRTLMFIGGVYSSSLGRY